MIEFLLVLIFVSTVLAIIRQKNLIALQKQTADMCAEVTHMAHTVVELQQAMLANQRQFFPMIAAMGQIKDRAEDIYDVVTKTARSDDWADDVDR